MQQQQPIQISLSDNVINLSVPNKLQASFSILNITLRPVIIFPIISHQDQMFVTNNRKIRILQAFESIQLQIGLKSMSLSINELIYPRMRIYYWEVKNFCDEDEILLEKDEAVLESEGMFGRRQLQGCEQKEGEMSQQQFQLMVGLEKRKKAILQKYRQKMFQIKNKSLQIYTRLKSTNSNANTSYANNQHQFPQQESSQQQQSFSQLLYRDFQINIQIEDSLHLSALYGQSSSRQYYLLENIIRPWKIKVLLEDKQKELENIEKQLFQVLEELGNVKEIDRLRGDGRQERVEQHGVIGGSQRRIGLMDSPQSRTQFTSNQSLQVKIPQQQVTLQRYLVQYKSPILQKTSTQPQVLSCHFIQITTAKHYYLFRMSKILSYDFYYRVKLDDGVRKNSGLDYARRVSQRRGRLPIIVDLRTVKIYDIREKKVKEGGQNNIGKDNKRKISQDLEKIIEETSVEDNQPTDNKLPENYSPKNKLPSISQNIQQSLDEKSQPNFQLVNSTQQMLHSQLQPFAIPSVPHQQQQIQQIRLSQSKVDYNHEIIEKKQREETKVDGEICIYYREEQQIDNSLNIQFQKQVDPYTKQHAIQLESGRQQSQLKSQPVEDPVQFNSLQENLPLQSNDNKMRDEINNISLVDIEQQQVGLEKMEKLYKEELNQVQLGDVIDENKQSLEEKVKQCFEVKNQEKEIMREHIQSHELQDSQKDYQHSITKLIQQPSALLKEQQYSPLSQQPKRQTISINQLESLKEAEQLEKLQLSMIESNRKGHSFEGEYNTRETLCKLSQEVNNEDKNKVQMKEVQSEGEEVDTVEMLSGISHNNINPTPAHNRKDSNNLSSMTSSSASNLSPPKKKPSLSQSFSHSLTSPHHHQQHLPPKYIDEFIIYPDPILAFHISYQVDSTQQDKNTFIPATVYLLFRTHLLYYPIGNPQLKTIIPLDPMKPQDTINFKTVITFYKNQQILAANGCYIYWISLAQKLSQWKYCQRKEIYSLQVIEEMGLLMVGGKNFSKLSYFGKETSRSNLKVYSCSKRSHLFTYDIPINQPVGNVMEMKYVTTPPTGGKLLCVYTNHNDEFRRLLFFRIRAFNIIQVYGKIQLHEIGIQSILGMKYNHKTARLVILEQVDSQHSSLKKLKLKSMYQKVEVLTQCIKMELGNYESFQLGGEKGQQWYSLIQKGKISSYIYRSNKVFNNPEIVKMQKQYHIDAVFDVPEGNVLVKGYDFVMIKKKITHTHQMNK